MKYVYVFRCKANKRLLGFTCKSTGVYLPDISTVKWELFKEIELTKQSKRVMGANPAEILESIAEDGYFLILSDLSLIENA
jgi:hypothetical protein